MPKIKVEFYVSSRYINTETKEIMNLEFPDESTQSEIDDGIQEAYEEWVWENIESSYRIIE